MAEAAELLRQIPVFADLPEDQIAWFLSQTREVRLKAGELYAKQGDPADAMTVLLEGEFQLRGGRDGDPVVIDLKGGEVTGLLPFSRMKMYTFTGRALTDGRLLRFPS